MKNSKEMYYYIKELEARHSRSRLKRAVITFALYFTLMFIILFFFTNMEDFDEIRNCSLIASAAIFIVNIIICNPLHDKTKHESDTLYALRVKYENELEEEGIFGGL